VSAISTDLDHLQADLSSLSACSNLSLDMDMVPSHLAKHMELYQGVKSAHVDHLVLQLLPGVWHMWHEVCLDFRDCGHNFLVQKSQISSWEPGL
jgi:hypothetical protein